MPEKNSPHICPYAAALSDDEEGSYHDPASPCRNDAENALSLARSKCPAFADNSCPFRGANDPESLRTVMKKVPPSHFPSSSSALQKVIVSQLNVSSDGGGDSSTAGVGGGGGVPTPTAFQLAMEHIHKVSTHLGTSKGGETSSESAGDVGGADVRGNRDVFIIPECPFKSFHRDHSSSSSSKTLARAMEDYSLAAIMGRMASWSEDEDDEGYELEHESVEGKDQKETPQMESPTDKSLQQQEMQQITSPASEEVKPEQSTLSHALKTGTAESHTSAENVHFVKNFIKGIIDRELYMELVTGLYHTYVTLEKLLEIHGPTHFPSLHFPKELSRTEALKEDMEFWHGIGWETKPECRVPSPAVQDYVNRMEEVGKIDPLLLLSHAYTRYLGDLSGGKVLSRIARRALNLSGYDGLQFYQFEFIASAKLFKDKYRAALDELTLRPDQIGRLVAEANVAFALNMRVFEELDVAGGVPGARVRDVREALVYYDREIEQQSGKKDVDRRTTASNTEAKCPFGFVGGPNPHAFTTGSKKEDNDVSNAPIELDSAVRISTKQETAEKKTHSGGRCPWPFVFFHDPMMGMRDWQTWFVMGLMVCWCWSRLNTMH